jgi:signal transduction histidine kinase
MSETLAPSSSGGLRQNLERLPRIRDLWPVPPRSARDFSTWVFPVLLAFVVLAVVVATPIVEVVWTQWRWFTGPTVDARAAGASTYAAVVAGANVSVVAGTLLSRWSPWGAAALVLWPFVTIPVTDTMVWGWWLALLFVTMVIAYDSATAVWPCVAGAVAVVVWYCLSGASALLPVGLVTAGTDASLRAQTMVLYLVVVAVVVPGSWVVGVLIRWQVRVRARAEAAESTAHDALEAEAVTSERARAARDLHDVVAHHVSLVAVRAESAPYVHPELDATAREVLGDIANDARDALDELRQVLTILQRAGHDEADAPRLPQPGSADVARLVADARDAGQVVDLVEPVPDLPPAQGYVVYRAVQEALTNARRHAPTEPVRVEVSVRSGVVGLRVTNAATATATPEPGRGLLGMRERAEALGGAADHAVDDGTFVLSVSLPLGGGEGEEW